MCALVLFVWHLTPGTWHLKWLGIACRCYLVQDRCWRFVFCGCLFFKADNNAWIMRRRIVDCIHLCSRYAWLCSFIERFNCSAWRYRPYCRKSSSVPSQHQIWHVFDCVLWLVLCNLLQEKEPWWALRLHKFRPRRRLNCYANCHYPNQMCFQSLQAFDWCVRPTATWQFISGKKGKR
jgi:hypothetical protein